MKHVIGGGYHVLRQAGREAASRQWDLLRPATRQPPLPASDTGGLVGLIVSHMCPVLTGAKASSPRQVAPSRAASAPASVAERIPATTAGLDAIPLAIRSKPAGAPGHNLRPLLSRGIRSLHKRPLHREVVGCSFQVRSIVPPPGESCRSPAIRVQLLCSGRPELSIPPPHTLWGRVSAHVMAALVGYCENTGHSPIRHDSRINIDDRPAKLVA